MKKGRKRLFRAMKSVLSDSFFRAVLFVVNFFIFIGENTKKIIALPLFFLLRLLRLVSSFFLRALGLIGRVIVKAIEWISIRKPKKKKIRIHLSPPKFSLPKFSFLRRFLSVRLKYFLFGTFVTFIILFIYQSYNFVKNLPSPTNIGKINYSLSSHIYDRDGRLLYEIYRDQNRTPIRLRDVPSYVTSATIAMEDKDFYNHKGISPIGGVLRALKDSLIYKKVQGGSTITQQLVKSALLTSERTIERKMREIILALWTERLFSKQQILEMYINQVPYGGSSYGIEEAAKTYFAKHAKDLTLSEAAFLAALPQAPTTYSPFVNPEQAKKRRNEVLRLMKEQDLITNKDYRSALAEDLAITPPKTLIKAPHFVFYVKSQLEELYGIKEVEEGGLKVTTTLDLEMQEEAEKILKEELEKIQTLNVSNGAILVTRPPTGEILAMVGSSDYFSSPYGAFNVTTALRQPGSSIKPIMYSLALQKGFTPASIIDDTPIVFAIAGSEPYRPVNYDGRFHGRVPLRYALANSYNVPAVRVLNTIGVNDFISHAKRMGITTWTDPSRFGLSLTLGGGEVKMVDMATAFGVFANQGYKVNLSPVLRLEHSSGRRLQELSPKKQKVINEGVAYMISDILSDNFARQWAFGSRSALELPGYKVAVKTGTTDEKKDNWTIGFTPDFLVTVWVGNNDNVPMNRYLTSGVTGAAPIWNRVMSYVLKRYGNGNSWQPKPDTIVEKPCYFGRTEFFLAGTEANISCNVSILKKTPTP